MAEVEEKNYSGFEIELAEGKGKLKAVCQFRYGRMLVRYARLIEGARGLFLAMPSSRYGGRWEDVVYFTDAGVKDEVQQRCMDMYKVKLEEKLNGTGNEVDDVPF